MMQKLNSFKIIPSLKASLEMLTSITAKIIFNCLFILKFRRLKHRAKKVESDSSGLMDFAIGLVNFVLKVARQDFLRGYLPSLSINYIAMSKDMGRRLPQLYYIKMKISYDLGFIAIGVTMAT